MPATRSRCATSPTIHWQSLMIVLTASARSLAALPFAAAEFAAGAHDPAGCARAGASSPIRCVFPSILAQIFYIRGVELIGANRAGLFINLVPIFGTLLSIVVAGEEFRVYHAVALAMVLGGIWLAEQAAEAAASRQLDQARLGEVAHQVACAVGPGRAVGRQPHAVDQRAELFTGDGDDVADGVREALARLAAILRPARTWCRDRAQSRRDTGDAGRSRRRPAPPASG